MLASNLELAYPAAARRAPHLCSSKPSRRWIRGETSEAVVSRGGGGGDETSLGLVAMDRDVLFELTLHRQCIGFLRTPSTSSEAVTEACVHWAVVNPCKATAGSSRDKHQSKAARRREAEEAVS